MAVFLFVGCGWMEVVGAAKNLTEPLPRGEEMPGAEAEGPAPQQCTLTYFSFCYNSRSMLKERKNAINEMQAIMVGEAA